MSSAGSKHDDEQMEGSEEEDQVVVEYKTYPMNTLLLVKSSQNQNGLRHNDYGRYHQYCIRKVHRLRKTLKFLQQSGNKQGQSQTYTQKIPSPESGAKLVVNQNEVKGSENSGERFLHLMIYRIEADWAFAMDLKQALSNQESGGVEEAKSNAAGLKNQSQLHKKNANQARNSFRLKVHARKRFAAMYKNCVQLKKVGDDCLDEFSKYELDAYVESMQAAFLIEAQKWQEALDALLRAKVILHKIQSFKDSLEAVIYQEKLSQLDTFIRLCCMHLKLKSSGDQESKLSSKLDGQIQQAYKSTKKEQIENIQEISFGGKQVPLKSERLKIIFKRVENHLALIEENKKQGSGKLGDLIKSYLQFVNILDDAQVVIKKEKAEELKKSEQSGQLFNILLQYTNKLKIKSSIDRNLIQAQSLQKQLNIKTIFEKSTQVVLSVRPQNIVRFYEKAIKCQKQLMNMEKESLDPLAAQQNEFFEKYQLIQISFYVALHYAAENQQMKQALVILQSCQYKIEDALQFAEQSNLKGDKINECVKELSESLVQQIDFVICKCQSKYLMQQHQKENSGEAQINSSLQQKGKTHKSIEFDNVYDILFDDSLKLKPDANRQSKVTIGGDQNDERALLNFLDTDNIKINNDTDGSQFELSKVKLSKQFKLISALPKLKSVPATPQFFDMAGGYIQYPDCSLEAKKYELQGGVLSGIRGFFGGQK